MIVNPFARWRVSQGWHKAHQAVDYATPWGTAFTAPAAGVYEHLGGSLNYTTDPTDAGLYGQVRLSDGRRIIVCHLSRHIAAHGARVEADETVIAATGNSGHVVPRPTVANPHNGSHMHTYGLTATGSRWNWTLDAQPAGGNSRPFPEETDMPLDAQKDYEAFKTMLHRALKWDVRDGNQAGADAKNGMTLWDKLGQILNKPTSAAAIDYDKLAAALAQQGVAHAVADELAQRLKS